MNVTNFRFKSIILIKKIFFLFLIIIGLTLVSCDVNQKKPLMLNNGVLDLGCWDFEKDGSENLDGEWEFYWRQFLTSRDFDTVLQKNYIPIPYHWNDYLCKETLMY